MIKQMVKVLVVIAVTFAMVQTAAVADAREGGKWNNPEKRAEMFEKMAEELDLSDDQRVDIKAHQQKKQTEMKKIHTAMREKRKELRKELEKKHSDEKKIRKIANALKKIQGRMIDNRIDGILTVKAILSPAQFKKFNEKIKGMMGKRGKRRGGE